MSIFVDEIRQQPEAIRTMARFYCSERGRSLLRAAVCLWQSPKCGRIVFTGMGSSCFLSGTAALMTGRAGKAVLSEDAGELLHDGFSCITPDTLLMLISQSGESYEITALLDRLEKENIKYAGIVGITNNTSSTLAGKADVCLPLLAGEEKMTSGKTFINSYLVILLLAKTLKGEALGPDDIGSLADEADKLVGAQEEFLPYSGIFDGCSFVQCIARGIGKSVSEQTALMFMEVCKLPASSMSGGAFRHGPIEAVGNSFTAVVFAHSMSGTYDLNLKLTKDILRYGGTVLLVSDVDSGIENENLREIRIPCTDPVLAQPLFLIPLQLIANQIAVGKGIEPGTFAHGNKITTIE